MTTQPTTTQPLPKTEAEVIARLKNPPEEIEVSVKTQNHYNGPPRQWVKLQYEFRDKLKKLGNFLYNIACDVEQAGGWVTQFSFSTASNLMPDNESPDDRRPHGRWRALFVYAHIRTQAEITAETAAWDEALKDLFKRHQK